MNSELPTPLHRMLKCAHAVVAASVDVLCTVGGIKEWIDRDLLEVDDRGIPLVPVDQLKYFAPQLRVLRDAIHAARESFAEVEFDLYRVEGETSATAEVIGFASKLYATLFGFGPGLMRSLPDDDEEVTAKLTLSFPHGWLGVKEMRLNARDTNQRIRKEIGRAAHLWEGKSLDRVEVSPQYVTLDQMAAVANRTKKTVERWYLKGIKKGKLPEPDVEGGGGNPHEWLWSHVRESLEQLSGKKMPERYHSLRQS